MADKMFRSAMTPRAWAFVLPALAVAVLLVATGLGELPRFSNRDASRYLLAYGPIAFGLVLAAVLGLALRLNLGRAVSVSRVGLRVQEAGQEAFNVRWGQLSYAERDRVLFRVLVLSDGRKLVRFVDIFVRDFGKLREEIYAHDRVLVTDSGREYNLG